MKTKLLKKTRDRIRRDRINLGQYGKDFIRKTTIDTAIGIVENAFYSWKWGFNTSAYEILVKHKLFNN